MPITRTGVISTFADVVVVRPVEGRMTIRCVTTLDGVPMGQPKDVELTPAQYQEFMTANAAALVSMTAAIDRYLVAEGHALPGAAEAVEMAATQVAEAKAAIEAAKAEIAEVKADAVVADPQ